jgi:small basic protein
LVATNSDIVQQKWGFLTDDKTGVNFEALYEAQYKESKVPGLFEKLLELLQAIINSGEVDSVQAIAALEKLVATIRANMRGTYFQTVGMSHFTFALMRNYLWKVLKKTPALGTMLEAIAETMKELDIEMSEVHSEVRKRLREIANGDVDAIEYKAHDLKALPTPEQREP